MKKLMLIAIFSLISLLPSLPADAIGTSPSSGEVIKINPPMVISEYSFTNSKLHYVQLNNTSTSSVVSLNGWSLEFVSASGVVSQKTLLSGLVAPGQYVVAANSSIVSPVQYELQSASAFSDTQRLQSVRLVPPASSIYLTQEAVPPSSITATGNWCTLPIPSGVTTSSTFYARRVRSTTSGSFTTSYCYLAAPPSTVYNDPLYQAASTPRPQIVEALANSKSCALGDTSPGCFDYVKFYNPTSSPIDLGSFRLVNGSSTTPLSGQLLAGQYGIFATNIVNSGGWVWLEDQYGYFGPFTDTQVAYPDSSASSKKGKAWSLDTSVGEWRWTNYPTPYNISNQFTDGSPLNMCDGLRINEIGANLKTQFIEVYNTGSEPLELKGCRLQTNRSQEVSYVFPTMQLDPGKLTTVYVADTNLTLTKTTTGTVYILSSDEASEVDAREYSDLSEDTSLSLVDGVWSQTFAVTPGAENQYEEYPPCEAGYVRNFETGRCNKIEIAPSLTPCLATQYRSSETNRCRNLLSTASSLTPCRLGQYRNPETNRCRSVAAASATFAPCAPGQVRNPDTHRCRKVMGSIAQAGFAPESAAEQTNSRLGWVAFGFVGTLAAGYAGWEWRREVVNAVRRVKAFLFFRK